MTPLGVTSRLAYSSQAVEYGAQGPIASGLVLLDALGLAGELGHPACKAGATFDGQDAPGEDAVDLFQGCFFAVAFEQAFEGSVERFGGFERETQVHRGLITPQLSYRTFSR